MAATLPRPARPSIGPPTTALPPLPVSRVRKSNNSNTHHQLDDGSSLPPPSTSMLSNGNGHENPSGSRSGSSMLREPRLKRTSSAVSLLPTTSSSSVNASTTSLGTFPNTPSKQRIPEPRKTSNLPSLNTTPQPTSTLPAGSLPRPGVNSSGKSVRRTISAAAFPQPPKSASSRIASLPPSPLSAGATTLKSAPPTPSLASMRQSASASTSPVTPQGPPHAKRTKIVSGGNSSLKYAGSRTPSLLNGSGDSKSISGGSGIRGSDGLLSIASPSESRTSSAQGSSSTSATTFEDSGDSAPRGPEGVDDSMGGSRDSKLKEGKGNVIVSVRVRPDAPGEQGKATGEWMVDGRRSLVAYRGREGGDYYYDNVFATHDQNARVYDASAKRLVRRVMEGYHGTVFAYGQTGTGKTFSMQGTATSPGVIPLAITDIFSYIRETPSREFLLRVSYLEIYNEKIHDLLSTGAGAGIGGPGASQQEEIKLREDSKRGVYASPLKEEIVQSPTQLLRVIARGDQARRTSSTQYNARSSRSHAVVQIVVESRERMPGNGSMTESKRSAMVPGGVRVSTLSLIDLAGSERAAEKKERRTEGAHINKSLLTLGTVIARLSGDKDKAGNPTDKDGKHLPYRDSKLTRLLQPALSGNSLVSILCTIQIGSAGGSAAAANSHTGETLNTLKFAARAKNNIVSHAKKAEEALGSGSGDAGSRVLLERYRMEILELRSELENQSQAKAADEEKEKEKEAELRHEEQMLEMQLARTALKERIEHLNRLILCSKSTGVNSSGNFSSLDQNPRQANGNVSSLSTRSTATAGDKQSRATSTGSTSTIGQHPAQSGDTNDNRSESGESGGEFGDGTATLTAQVRALQADLADRNRYISTLEKRLLQARRTSHSRTSVGFSPQKIHGVFWEEDGVDPVIKEKDAEIADLKARLDDKDRMVTALRSAARKRDVADVTSDPGSSMRRVSSSPDTSSGGARRVNGHAKGKASSDSKKGADEMSRMLDELIQGRVAGNGGMVVKRKAGSKRLGSFGSDGRRAGSGDSSLGGTTISESGPEIAMAKMNPPPVVKGVVVPPGMI